MIHGFWHQVPKLRKVNLNPVNPALGDRHLFVVIPLSSRNTAPSFNTTIRLETGVRTRSRVSVLKRNLVALNLFLSLVFRFERKTRRISKEVEPNEAMSCPHGLQQARRVKRSVLLDQNVQSHESKAGFVRIELYAQQSFAGAVFQTNADVRVRIVAADCQSISLVLSLVPLFQTLHPVVASTAQRSDPDSALRPQHIEKRHDRIDSSARL